MSNPNDIKRQIADNLLRELSDRGQIIEGGWRAMEMMTGMVNASEIQRSECRKAFFFGAQHLYASMMVILDPGDGPTEQDLERMSKIHNELEAFVESVKK